MDGWMHLCTSMLQLVAHPVNPFAVNYTRLFQSQWKKNLPRKRLAFCFQSLGQEKLDGTNPCLMYLAPTLATINKIV